MRAVFHLFTILVKVVEPEAIRICRTRLWKRLRNSSSTRRKHCAVRSFVTYGGREGLKWYFLHTYVHLNFSSLVISFHPSPDPLHSSFTPPPPFTPLTPLLHPSPHPHTPPSPFTPAPISTCHPSCHPSPHPSFAPWPHPSPHSADSTPHLGG